jgi:hypothetical protein
MRTLRSFKDLHRGAPILVCGCGSSLNELHHPERFITIGVNDVGRRFDPDYLVVVDPVQQFQGDRFAHVRASRARYLFTQRSDLDLPHPAIVRFRLGEKEGTDCSDPDVLHYGVVTPYVAICLAAQMGAATIGVIGVDFTDHHFFGPTGPHPWAPHLAVVDEQFYRLGAALLAQGVRVFNLSPASRVTAFPRLSQAAFAALPSREPVIASPRLRIVCAAARGGGVAAGLAGCLNAGTPHLARHLAPGAADIDPARAPDRAAAVLAAADAVVLEDGRIAPPLDRLLAGKPVVTLAASGLDAVDPRFLDQGFPGVLIDDAAAGSRAAGGWTVLPEPVPADGEPTTAAGRLARLLAELDPAAPGEGSWSFAAAWENGWQQPIMAAVYHAQGRAAVAA